MRLSDENTRDRRHKTLGYFDNIEDAIACRKQGEEKYFGEFRPTN